jgi:predicted ATPase
VSRLHQLVEQWQTLQARQADVYSPRHEYISIVSEKLFRKSVHVDNRNEVIVNTDDGMKIPRSKLSSGEKQLLIFLSETLLQERRSHIFLADEPELSLHVEWQEELVQNLIRMNPNAQVIFATHSPDIVGSFQKMFSRKKWSSECLNVQRVDNKIARCFSGLIICAM